MAALSGETGGPRRAHSAMRNQPIGRGKPHGSPGRAAQGACTSCPKSAWAAARCRRWALAHNLLLTRTRGRWRAAGCAPAWCASRREHHQRFKVGCAGRGTRRRSRCRAATCKVHRGPRDRGAKSAADRLAAHLGRGRGHARRRSAAKSWPARRRLRVLVVSEELDELFEICDRLHGDRKGPLSVPTGPRLCGTIERSASGCRACGGRRSPGAGGGRTASPQFPPEASLR